MRARTSQDMEAAHELTGMILGVSPGIERIRRDIMRLAPAPNPVVVTGPTGSGKELVAQALHRVSHRTGRLVAVNVCAIPDTMFESTLFGHVRGAFTGAHADSPGLMLEADGGTLFLDEIGSLGLMEQAKLLRAVETGEFRPVGGRADKRSRFRVVVATNQDLGRLVDSGAFREDLWYRLRGTVIDVPPLQERREDIELLARYFLQRCGSHVRMTTEAMRILRAYEWPGNVRELKHSVESAAALASDGSLGEEDIRRALRWRDDADSCPAAERERNQLVTTLTAHGWDTARAAAVIGVHRVTIYRRMRRLGIRPPRFAGLPAVPHVTD